jgi:beta-glucanase (GH16 family)
MNAHNWRENGVQNHWSCGGKWEAPWRLAEGFHVYGFEWTPQELRFDVDGVCVRSAPNTHWHVPMHLIFDSETMPDWFGLPRHEDLPSFFTIDYVRAWSRGDETDVLTEDEANARDWPPPK